MLEYIEINPETKAQASIIWLHGLGANGNDFVPLVPQLKLPSDLAIRFIFPHAPNRPVTINFGYVMPAWYDIYSLNREMQEDAEGIEQSSNAIIELIEKEKNKGIASEKIMLAGFSQGGAIALHTGLHYPEKLAGIIALSTYIPLHKYFGRETEKANSQTPIFMAHGEHDDIVPLEFAELSKNLLQKNNYSVDWKTYPMTHSVCLEEIKDIQHFIIKHLTV